MRPGSVPYQEASEEVVLVDAEVMQELELHAVRVPELTAVEARCVVAAQPDAGQLGAVAGPRHRDVVHRDGDVVEVDPFDHGHDDGRRRTAVSKRPGRKGGLAWPAMDFRTESLRGLADAVKSRRVGARELVAHALERIEAVNPQVNTFVAVDGERALAEASRIDDRVAAGESVGPLAGIPIGVKDLEPAAGFVTSFGSRLFADDPPAEADSVQVGRLRAAGAVVVGKTNTPEEGWKGDTDNLVFGRTANPWSLTHSAGGSSGGSAAAIAAGMVPMATGSDGGGSIRIPSALCGLTGMKASFGRVAVGGDAPGWVDLSARGPMARRLADIAYALEVVAGPHPTDPRSLPSAPGLFALGGLPPLPRARRLVTHARLRAG